MPSDHTSTFVCCVCVCVPCVRVRCKCVNGTQHARVGVYLVFLAGDDLGGHPVGGAHDGDSLVGESAAQLRAVAKVRDLDRAVEAHQDVVRLDVAVDDRMRARVQIMQTLHRVCVCGVCGVCVCVCVVTKVLC